ncbi:hydroxyacid dehydrogenase [Candidatus Woesearchaeota archaeon]|jgi:D-lactate dehydrogenase|nr:hydroxyacid dehydrogenase [Candidatus Woesearchaeota archaeon]MBT4111306.1 hydroxyacid dehydrogenase [Candidatus Woesearchaeota archaeon]MBT4335783.1 hydroxyacid dehydrogenase [Candidatus Woesearchaeota archaeon]MBT4469239.1 hydroxyacid dehydrogenase [Candidatus Woesearchaeota archaeon]MBT6744404.1 hydroxyacid dehydrogenase [Candidatus Woesearchaeota archaeon]
MKIGFFELEPWEKKEIRKVFSKDKLFFSEKRLTLRNVRRYKELEAIAIFVHSEIDKEVLKKLPKLKYITTMSTGFNHIDLEECKKRRISVSNVPTYGENTVAEHTFALILALSRKIVDCVNRTHLGSFRLEGLRGFDLKDKTIGVVGGGNIGKHVIRMAKGFEMNVLVFDIYKDIKLAKKLGYKYASMEKMLKESDVITLHVPENKHTHHLIDKDKLTLMKKSAVLINTSRGGIVDTKALVNALKKKKIAGAALDVLEDECKIIEETQLLKKEFGGRCDLHKIVEKHALLKMKNVIVTPHNAFNTHEALMRILQTTIKNLASFKNGRKINEVK